ncbi:hypothetical protein MSAR_13800 [Mycolicibacterium sarraceniae]|uniref:Uncharacterized protein n=1 Tax=Mycolicibacterium sarraceniae TaxID=1534348 RepID=A0A7I7SMN5_9MYCO|nr:hypothetical protein MSAR_13800 [Mycolicibacterium sarraceniae]
MEPVFRTLEIAASMAARAAGTTITFEGFENIPARGGAWWRAITPATSTSRLLHWALVNAGAGELVGVYPHPPGEYWVPEVLGGGASILAEAKRLDEAELARRARHTREHH